MKCHNVTMSHVTIRERGVSGQGPRCNMKMEDVRLARWRDGAAVKGIPMEDGRWKDMRPEAAVRMVQKVRGVQGFGLARWRDGAAVKGIQLADGRWKM